MELEEQLDNCVCCDFECPGFCIVEGTIGIDFNLQPVATVVNLQSIDPYCECWWDFIVSQFVAGVGNVVVDITCSPYLSGTGEIIVSTNQGSQTQVVTLGSVGRNPSDPRDDCCPPDESGYQPFTLTPSSFTLDGIFIELIGFYFDCTTGTVPPTGPPTTTTPPPYPTTYPTFPTGYYYYPPTHYTPPPP